jgi:hypothetical protein
MEHQAEATSTRPTILLLGTGHWSNPNRDMLNVQYDDMLAPQRQQEIRECVERLKRFRPTKVALEIVADQSSALNDDYRQYRAGTFTLTANERHQLGFRIAAELQHEQVYAIDWQGIMGWDRALSFAREHNQATKLDEYAARARQEIVELNARLTTVSTLDLLRDANDQAGLEHNHQWYMLLALVGEDNQYVGADVICNWYGRNLKIFVNLTRITASPQDRILVIIGAGHIPLLTHFVQGFGLYTLEPVAPYLS